MENNIGVIVFSELNNFLLLNTFIKESFPISIQLIPLYF